MTQYPEVALARELEICYLNISLITDYDAGLEGTGIEPVTAEEVMRVFRDNNRRVRELIFKLIPRIPTERTQCSCDSALKSAVVS
jgi:5'-methylthioadenosine phosphorylase